MSFESKVLQGSNQFNRLPITSNNSFLIEWWKIFFETYLNEVLAEFKKKNPEVNQNIINSLNSNDFFKNHDSSKSDNLKEKLDANKNNLITHTDPNLNLFPLQNSLFDYLAWRFNLNNYYSSFLGSSAYKELTSQFNASINSNYSYDAKLNTIIKENCFPEFERILSEKDKIRKSEKYKQDKYIFNVTKAKSVELDDKVLTQKRRMMKNKKLVFVHPKSKIAKKLSERSSYEEKQYLYFSKPELSNSNNVKDEENSRKIDPNFVHDKPIETSKQSNNRSNWKTSRASPFRGVSRNGNLWQVLIMIDRKKRYIGTYQTETGAARIYDKVTLQHHGVTAKTNFPYKEEEITKILNEPKVFKSRSPYFK